MCIAEACEFGIGKCPKCLWTFDPLDQSSVVRGGLLALWILDPDCLAYIVSSFGLLFRGRPSPGHWSACYHRTACGQQLLPACSCVTCQSALQQLFATAFVLRLSYACNCSAYSASAISSAFSQGSALFTAPCGCNAWPACSMRNDLMHEGAPSCQLHCQTLVQLDSPLAPARHPFML